MAATEEREAILQDMEERKKEIQIPVQGFAEVARRLRARPAVRRTTPRLMKEGRHGDGHDERRSRGDGGRGRGRPRAPRRGGVAGKELHQGVSAGIARGGGGRGLRRRAAPAADLVSGAMAAATQMNARSLDEIEETL